MSLHRPPLPTRASSSSSGLETPGESGYGLTPLLAEISVFVVPAKLDVGAVIAQIDALGGERVSQPKDARIIVTALRGRPRLARVLDGALVSEQQWESEV